ncbi:MAG: hypothetical protein CMG47_01395 [Candidatus Marinimicrobia bacterium]|nr:hypothetical protein [Candidatus Neomarinimicrobiota bacterium]
MTDSNIEEIIFLKGIDSFNDKSFYDAHESWELLWTEYALQDALFVQGLIQLSVAFFHITNLNLIGSKNLFNKCLPKLKKFPSNHRDLNLSDIIDSAEESLKMVSSIDKVSQFDWELAPEIVIKK